MSRSANLRLPRAIFFDMDGTITRPLLDFDSIRRDLGITGPILEALRHLHGEELLKAHRILDEHERAASEQSELNDGCIELLSDLAANGCRTALITRNSRSSTKIILNKHQLRFDIVFTREDEPAKPDPEALLRAMKLLNRQRHEVWMVGDGCHDIEAAEAAGVTSVWISHGTRRHFEMEPTVAIERLHELLPILKTLRHSPTGCLRV